MSSFTTPLKAECLTKHYWFTRWFGAVEEWEIRELFQYHVGNRNSDEKITVSIGFITDFASIPFPFNLLPGWSRKGKYAKAAVIHDWLYSVASGGKYTKEEADLIFLEAMEILGVGKWQREIMYKVVVKYGGSRWKHAA